MRQIAVLLGIVFVLAVAGWSQGTAPTKKPVSTHPAAATASGPTAIIETSAGNLTCKLFPKEAPIGVANFIGLADGSKDWTNPVSHLKKHGVPLYDGTIFHRVIPEFMIQGGDPAGTGSGDIGFAFKNETTPLLKFDRPGRLAYANAGPGTNGSQFFITEQAFVGQQAQALNGGYTIFGQCDEPSVEIVKKIARMPRDANDRPNHPVKIIHIKIVTAAAHPAVHRPAASPAKPAPKAPAQ